MVVWNNDRRRNVKQEDIGAPDAARDEEDSDEGRKWQLRSCLFEYKNQSCLSLTALPLLLLIKNLHFIT